MFTNFVWPCHQQMMQWRLWSSMLWSDWLGGLTWICTAHFCLWDSNNFLSIFISIYIQHHDHLKANNDTFKSCDSWRLSLVISRFLYILYAVNTHFMGFHLPSVCWNNLRASSSQSMDKRVLSTWKETNIQKSHIMKYNNILCLINTSLNMIKFIAELNRNISHRTTYHSNTCILEVVMDSVPNLIRNDVRSENSQSYTYYILTWHDRIAFLVQINYCVLFTDQQILKRDEDGTYIELSMLTLAW